MHPQGARSQGAESRPTHLAWATQGHRGSQSGEGSPNAPDCPGPHLGGHRGCRQPRPGEGAQRNQTWSAPETPGPRHCPDPRRRRRRQPRVWAEGPRRRGERRGGAQTPWRPCEGRRPRHWLDPQHRQSRSSPEETQGPGRCCRSPAPGLTGPWARHPHWPGHHPPHGCPGCPHRGPTRRCPGPGRTPWRSGRAAGSRPRSRPQARQQARLQAGTGRRPSPPRNQAGPVPGPPGLGAPRPRRHRLLLHHQGPGPLPLPDQGGAPPSPGRHPKGHPAPGCHRPTRGQQPPLHQHRSQELLHWEGCWRRGTTRQMGWTRTDLTQSWCRAPLLQTP